jgi:hypothetical protein
MRPPLGLRSDGGAVVEVSSSCGGGDDWTEEDGALLGGGGGVDHTANLITGDLPLGPLAPDLGARVLLGLACAPTLILTMSRGSSLNAESSFRKISMGTSFSSTFPSPVLVIRTSGALTQPGRGIDPYHGWHMAIHDALSERLPGMRAPPTNRSVDLGREMGASPDP